jgi:HEAT repeat protein
MDARIETPGASGARQDSETVGGLVERIRSKDGMVRQEARERLVRSGKAAVIPLMAALRDASDQTRWEAAKSLSEIGDARAAGAMVIALEDPSGDVRWVAAEGLVGLGSVGLGKVLDRLKEEPERQWLREGAHHVAHDLARQGLARVVKPLLEALDSWQPSEAVLAAVAATETLLRAHERHPPSRASKRRR